MNRDRAAERVLTRLGAGRSAWNAADVRGEVEQLIASSGIIADAVVRAELAEDLTARALERCVPLLVSESVVVRVPEHIRALTSRPVLDVEAELAARFTARATQPAPGAELAMAAAGETVAGLSAGQARAVAALTGDRVLVVVEGAAGAGKTTTLAAVRCRLDQQGRALTVVSPTLKAAKVASTEVGAAAGSAAWLVFQHGWRWTPDGVWTRLTVGQTDPHTGRGYAGPVEGARLTAGDLLVIDEAGMLDQDTARALLTIADECGVRVALLGDRQQLTAVGRGGVIDLAVAQVTPAAHLTLDEVHRFVRADQGGRRVPDGDYADLTLAMRRGEDPGAVFDALAARGLIRLHADEAARRGALAAIAAESWALGSERPAVVADTLEQTAAINTAIRAQLVTDGRVDDTRVVTTRAGQQIGVGDRISTRRNDHHLGVANRDTWTVTAVDEHGHLVVGPADVTSASGGRGDVTPTAGSNRTLPAEYVAMHVELAYASTAHGVQGDTVMAAHVVISERTGAASAYVGMTRGRRSNTAHLIAADLTEARDQWIAVFARDRADLGPGHARVLAAEEAARYAPNPSPAVRRPQTDDLRRLAPPAGAARGIGR